MTKTAIIIKQVYIPYWEWEDWINGMWRKIPKDEEPAFIQTALNFMSNTKLYGGNMKIVISKWPRTMLNSLTNPSINKRAFLGHCAVQFAIQCPEHITRMAWPLLTEEQRIAADKVAQETINEWREKYAST